MRKLVCVLLALVCAFAFTACGETSVDGNGGNNGNSTVVTPGGDTGNGGGLKWHYRAVRRQVHCQRFEIFHSGRNFFSRVRVRYS